jgi:hypothetical protein
MGHLGELAARSLYRLGSGGKGDSMARKQGEESQRLTITLTDAAKELGVSPETIMRWVEGGHLPVFIPPGVELARTNGGPRGYKLWIDQWEAFKRQRTFVVGNSEASSATHATVTGIDLYAKPMKRERMAR